MTNVIINAVSRFTAPKDRQARRIAARLIEADYHRIINSDDPIAALFNVPAFTKVLPPPDYCEANMYPLLIQLEKAMDFIIEERHCLFAASTLDGRYEDSEHGEFDRELVQELDKLISDSLAAIKAARGQS